ncbi:MAG: Holliday junction branch migration protein RuvA [Candidatus Brocadiae bacterium]|nr:Holliday junction branch migration protein RuvA [Candidatus Brocadiia bacterium]
MFEYIQGKISCLSTDIVVVDVSGVGFKIYTPANVKDKLKQGEMAKIFISVCLREDSLKLFGFLTMQDRELFEKVQTVSGIGPSLALHVLNAGSPQEFYNAVMQENLAFFKKIKGIGPKMASRIVLELKGNLPKTELEPISNDGNNFKVDAIKALLGLGYQELQASEAVRKAFIEIPSPKNLEVLLYEALKHI